MGMSVTSLWPILVLDLVRSLLFLLNGPSLAIIGHNGSDHLPDVNADSVELVGPWSKNIEKGGTVKNMGGPIKLPYEIITEILKSCLKCIFGQVKHFCLCECAQSMQCISWLILYLPGFNWWQWSPTYRQLAMFWIWHSDMEWMRMTWEGLPVMNIGKHSSATTPHIASGSGPSERSTTLNSSYNKGYKIHSQK